MAAKRSLMPRARKEGLEIQDLVDEVLVYDLERQRLCVLFQPWGRVPAPFSLLWRGVPGTGPSAERMRMLNTALCELGTARDEQLLECLHGAPDAFRLLHIASREVKSAELSIVRAALHDLGFVTPSSSSSLFTKGLVAFDLHTDLIGSARIRRRASAFRLDSLCLWEKALPLERDADELLVLSNPHQFLHLAVHALKHSYTRFVWLVDLALVSRRIDWSELLDEAEASGTMRALAYAVRGLESLLGVTIPPGVTDALPPPSQARARVCEPCRNANGDDALGRARGRLFDPDEARKDGLSVRARFPQTAGTRRALSRHTPGGSCFLADALRSFSMDPEPLPDSAARIWYHDSNPIRNRR